MKILVSLLLLASILTGCGNSQKSMDDRSSAMSKDQANAKIQEFLQTIDPKVITPTKNASDANVSKIELPSIDEYPFVVDSDQAETLELWSSTEKAGKGNDGFLREQVENFNALKLTNPVSGKTMGIKLKSIASGLATQYILDGVIPDAFSPSSNLWLELLAGGGKTPIVIEDNLVKNTAGIVLKKSALEEVFKGKIPNFEGFVDAVMKGQVQIAYPDPTVSTTGLNFVSSLVYYFAGNSEANINDPAIIDAMVNFQKSVPFTSMTTLHLRESLAKGQKISAAVLESQTFQGLKDKSDYEFIPFGVAHNNPLVIFDTNNETANAIARAFGSFIKRLDPQEAQKFGFPTTSEDKSIKHSPKFLKTCQSIWKQTKDATRSVVAVFVADVSGSMDGLRMTSLKKALINGANNINPKNSIGLVSFASNVSILLPIGQFNEEQKNKYLAAVEEMIALDKTAMFDGIITGLSMLQDELKRNPKAKPILFVLTDGETNRGYDWETTKPIMEGIGIPIYTISYGEDISVLSELSSLNEAASLKSSESQIQLQIGGLLNAQL